MSKSDRAPRPYSRLNPTTGKIEWVCPGDARPQTKKRTRLESDDEVRARIMASKKSYWEKAVKESTSQQLDNMLRNLDMPARRCIEEDA